jgi:DNA polymerase-4
MAHYQAESRAIFEIFRRFTPLVEALSLDEAFLDVTASRSLYGPAEEIAATLKNAIRDETGLVASVGVAGNKFLAKLASDQDKPDGLFVVRDDQIQAFMDPLPVRRIWGIGRKAEQRLESIGVHTVRQLRASDRLRLKQVLGNQVDHFLALAQGLDDRPVTPAREDKSISNEVTFDRDLKTEPQCREALLELACRVGARTRAKHLGGRTVTVKIRNRAFRTFTRSHTLSLPLNDDRSLYQEAVSLFSKWWAEAGPASIRLLGVGVSKLETIDQLPVNVAGSSQIDGVADEVRRRFGDDALRPATLVRPEEPDK